MLCSQVPFLDPVLTNIYPVSNTEQCNLKV